jgi:hypothetical protein
VVEVHISNTFQESFINRISGNAKGVILGFGLKSYELESFLVYTALVNKSIYNVASFTILNYSSSGSTCIKTCPSSGISFCKVSFKIWAS